MVLALPRNFAHFSAEGSAVAQGGVDTAWADEMDKGKDLMRRRQYEDALKSFKRANEMRNKKCGVCFAWMAEAYLNLEAYKNVLDSAEKTIEFADGDKQLLLRAYNHQGISLQILADKKDQKKLQVAETAFRNALAIEGVPPLLHYNLGVTLLQLNRDAEGVAALKQYVKLEPRGANADSANKMIENPRRARENYAPDFSFTTAEGEFISLEDLRGKVVVLDFWGTWCPPCVESVPELRTLHKRYSKEPSFMLIGISSDSDEQEWKEFTAKEKMIWPQYRDKDRKVQRAFNVRAWPTYVVIDHEGIVQFRSVGFSWQRAGNLDDAIRKQVKIVAKSTENR
jgi:peroxiredoxin